MSYINRDSLDEIGYKCSVQLSAHIGYYPNLYGNADIVSAPKFSGFGLYTNFVTDRYMVGFNIVHNNPRFEVYSSTGTLLTTIYGDSCNLSITVKPSDIKELVDFQFQTDTTTGEYLWRGLKNSNLPDSRMTVSYSLGSGYSGQVNGISYSASGAGSMALTRESSFVVKTTSTLPPSGATGSFSGMASVMGDAEFLEGARSYTVSGTSNINGTAYTCALLAKSMGNSIKLSGTHVSAFSSPSISTAISSYPVHYKYNVSNLTTELSSSAEFSDCNGKTWTGMSSPYFEYQGVQSVLVGGTLSGATPAYDPAYNYTSGSLHGWTINDPAPSFIGDVNLTNPEAFNDVSIEENIYNSEGEVTGTRIVKNTRVEMLPTLNSSGGDVNFSLSTVEIDNFDTGWVGIGCSVAAGEITGITGKGAIEKTFTRPKYSNETGDIPASLLLPHLPINTTLKLSGTFVTGDKICLQITSKEKVIDYSPQNSTAPFEYDLTRPAGSGLTIDTVGTYYDNCMVENLVDYNGVGAYTEETVGQGSLYGSCLITKIRIWGFSGDTSLASLSAVPGDLEIVTSNEFATTRECGGSGAEDTRHTLERNRYVTLLQSGRFADIPNNNHGITDMGIETWEFPLISQLTPSGPNKLVFPRDDYNSLTVTAPEAAGGANPTVDDLFSEQAFIGWLEQGKSSSGNVAIRPRCDSMNCTYFYLADYDNIDCVCNIGAYYEGFVDKVGDSAVFTDSSYFSDASFTDVEQYISAKHGSPLQIDYKISGDVKDTKNYTSVMDGIVYRHAARVLGGSHGKILRNAAGKILRNSAGKILRGDYKNE